MRHCPWIWMARLLVLILPLSVFGAEAAPGTAREGRETLARIRQSFRPASGELLVEEIGGSKPPHPAWIWDASVQLQALCSAARQEPAIYLPQVKTYAAALRAHRTMYRDRAGLDVNPPPKKSDRYYDDNAWICLALLEAYDLTHDPADLALATDAYQFALSGEDLTTLGGGVFWHEGKTETKNACSSGPIMLAALRFHQLTHDAKHLETAKRLYDWTRSHLQDPADGLVFDSITVPAGDLNRAKFTYNSATLISAACGLRRATGDRAYLDEAKRVAHAAEKQFVRPEDGAVTGPGKLGVKLIEAFLTLHEIDHDEHWRQVVGRSVDALRHHHNDKGWYPQPWQSPPPTESAPARLIDQSAPARAYWLTAEHGIDFPREGH